MVHSFCFACWHAYLERSKIGVRGVLFRCLGAFFTPGPPPFSKWVVL